MVGNGAPGAIRTPGPQIRSLMLYPAELRAHKKAVVSRKVPKVQPRCVGKFRCVEGRMIDLKQTVLVIVASSAVMVTGCTERGEPPSLAKRPFETIGAPPPVVAIKPKPSNPARVARIASFLNQARQGQSKFATNVATAEKVFASARGASVTSEPWFVAQLAISRLTALRSPVQVALANLDNERRLLIGDMPSEDEAGLNAALIEVESISNAQADTVARLSAMLRSN